MSSALKVRARGGASAPPRAEHVDGTENKNLLLPGDHERLQAIEKSSRFTIPVGTHWVERDVLYVSEEIARRWPNLAVVSCSCGKCLTVGHHPHMVVESCRDGQTRPVFGFVKFGRHIIEQLAAAHVSNNTLERIHKNNADVLEQKRKAHRERTGEASEMLVSALRSHKLSWTARHGDKVIKTDTTRRGRVI